MYNMGKKDQVVRFIAGSVVLAIGIAFNMPFIGTMGGIFMALSFIGNCPFYCLLKIDSCQVRSKENSSDI